MLYDEPQINGNNKQNLFVFTLFYLSFSNRSKVAL